MDQFWNDESVLELLRKAVFAPMVIREGGRTRKVPALLAYMMQLGAEAVSQKRKGVSSERLWLVECLERKGKLDVKGEIVSSAISIEIAKHKEYTDHLSEICGVMYYGMYPEICARFEVAHGQKIDAWHRPYWLDLSLGKEWLKRCSRRRRRARVGQPYPVGKRKTPVSTRWAKGQSGNPAGRKAENSWDQLANSLRDPLIVRTSDGKRSTLTRIEVEIAQTFLAAMASEKQARLSIRRYVTLLDRKGLLSPPPAPPKRKRFRRTPKNVDTRREAMTKVQFWLLARLLYRELMSLLSAKYGHIPNFTTKVERDMVPNEAELNALDLGSMGFSFDELAANSAPSEAEPVVGPEDDFEHSVRQKAERRKASRKARGKISAESAEA